MTVTWHDVSTIAGQLPEAEEGVRLGGATWRVGKHAFVWVRPLRARDRDELGDAAPTGEIVGASTADVGEKFALIDEDSRAFFTTSHFEGYAGILIALDHVDPERLREVVTDAWLARAPKRLAAEFLSGLES